LLPFGFMAAFAAWAQVPPGYNAASFARIGVGVRALGMAGAFAANPSSSQSVYF